MTADRGRKRAAPRGRTIEERVHGEAAGRIEAWASGHAIAADIIAEVLRTEIDESEIRASRLLGPDGNAARLAALAAVPLSAMTDQQFTRIKTLRSLSNNPGIIGASIASVIADTMRGLYRSLVRTGLPIENLEIYQAMLLPVGRALARMDERHFLEIMNARPTP